jgi:hypothetical protein
MSHKSEEPVVKEGPQLPPSARPSPVLFLFAAALVVGMFFNMIKDGSDTVTISLAGFALLCLGVDVGKMIGRR